MFEPTELTIQNFLSRSIILVCLVSKLPQLARVIQSDSVKGISVTALGLEIFRQSILSMYHYHHGYAISMYLDHLSTWLQQSIVFFFVVNLNAKNHYSATKKGSFPLLCCYMISVICMSVILPKYTLDYLIILCPMLNILGRFTQVFRIVRTQSGDGISLITWGLSAYASCARICILLLDAHDKIILINSMVALLGSASILMSAFYYQKNLDKKYK